jgi:hypothetical protein
MERRDMAMKRVSIQMGPLPRDLRVQLEGVEIADGLAGITVKQAGDPPAAQIPTVHLELALAEIQIEGSALVTTYVTDRVRDALIALGWTPPEAERPEDARAAVLVFQALERLSTPWDDAGRRTAAAWELLNALGFKVPAGWRARDPRTQGGPPA